MTTHDLDRAAREHFGHALLRREQRRAVEALLGGSDVLVTLPTGGGKSLIYQLPAVLEPGLVLVVSPLIALMQDQVDALRRRDVRATFVNSTLSPKERARRLEGATAGEYDLLYVTPERFRSARFRAAIPKLDVRLLAVDEAHCISSWGHDFRPDYWKLGEYRALLGDPPTVALTATATPRVADDIVRALRLDAPVRIRTGIDRPNLFLSVREVVHAEDKLPILVDRIRRIDGPGIVYSTLIRDLEALEVELARVGIPSLVYHGKLSADERRSMQSRFMEGERHVVLATNAFGMGVDKADIRFVLHAQLPRTLEAWTQEIGRAGRDGEPAFAELVYLEEDLAIQQEFVRWANPDRTFLVSVYELLKSWGPRAATKDEQDLRGELLLKNRRDNRVGIVLKWLEVLGLVEGSFERHDLRVVGELELGALPAFVGTDAKLEGDLASLLTMVRFAKRDDRCRLAALEEHFGIEATPGVPHTACDVCHDREAWIDAHFQSRPATLAPDPEAEPDAAAPFRRGDWVEIDGRHLGQVLRVDGTGSRTTLLVESAGDFRRRQVRPARTPVRRLEP
ncbi:MAG: RecQ family ATP-dependent DNA helicase [Planctomycetota bacterium]